jgi:hypothetical protein
MVTVRYMLETDIRIYDKQLFDRYKRLLLAANDGMPVEIWDFAGCVLSLLRCNYPVDDYLLKNTH